MAPEAFTWRDGERLIRFGTGVLAEAPRLLADGQVDALLVRGVGGRREHLAEGDRLAARVGGVARVTWVVFPQGLLDHHLHRPGDGTHAHAHP